MSTYTATGDLATLLPPRSACARGSTTVHAAVDTIAWLTIYGEETSHRYPDTVSLCGTPGWGDAGGGVRTADQRDNLDAVNCVRCKATRRWRDHVTAATKSGDHP